MNRPNVLLAFGMEHEERTGPYTIAKMENAEYDN